MSTAHPVAPILRPSTASKGMGRTAGYALGTPEQLWPGRLTAAQGRALEMLGHAIEYLVDSRLASADEFCSPAAQEAIQLLSRANREVYLTAPAPAPTGGRVMRLMRALLG